MRKTSIDNFYAGSEKYIKIRAEWGKVN